jgi:hypothetical protein
MHVMNKRVSMAVAGALILSAPMGAQVQGFQNCAYDCRAAWEAALRLCAGKTGELLRACRARAEKTRVSCMTRCTVAENTRLRIQQQRDRETAERRRLRSQPEPQKPR